MEKQTLELDQEVAQNIAYEDYDDKIYEIISNKIISKGRWTYRSELIIKTLEDGRFWKAYYNQGATESQDESPFEYGKSIFEEVFPKEVKVIVYE